MSDTLSDGRQHIWWAEDAVWLSPLSQNALLVYLYLCRRADKQGSSFPSRNDIATNARCSVSSVRTALLELHAAGAVEVVSGATGGGSNHYRVMPVSAWQPSTINGGWSTTNQGVVNHQPGGSQPLTPKEVTSKEVTSKEVTSKETAVVGEEASPQQQAALTLQDPPTNGQPLDVDSLVALWNTEAPKGLPRVKDISDGRRKKARAILRQFPHREWWQQVMREYRASSFLQGLKNGRDHEHFKADFDWLMAKSRDGTENAVRVHEGRYRDGVEEEAPYGGKFG